MEITRLFTLSDINYFLSVQKQIDAKLKEKHEISEEMWQDVPYDAIHGALFYSQKGLLIDAAQKEWNPMTTKKFSRTEVLGCIIECMQSLMRISAKHDENGEKIVERMDKGLESLKDENYNAGFYAAFSRIESFEMNIACLNVLLNELGYDRESFITAFNRKTQKLIK